MNIIKKSTELTKSPIFAILSCLLCILAGYSIKSSLIEIFASVMGIINVWLLSKEKISNFIFGIITVLAYLYIYYTTGLYALAILACFQVIFNIYGWYYWGKGELLWIAIILLLWAVWGYVEINILHAQNAILDSLTAILGFIAQYWLSRKLYENWILWIISNLLFMVIYVLNGYFIMLILVIIQFILSIAGLIEWYESYLEQGRNKIMF